MARVDYYDKPNKPNGYDMEQINRLRQNRTHTQLFPDSPTRHRTAVILD